MKAFVLKQAGGIENLVIKELDLPVIREHEVLVKVKAISINPVEAAIRKSEDWLRLLLHLKKDEAPILGWDISGIVEKTGNAVTAFRNGDEVFGMVNFTGHGKAYADYVAAPAGQLALKPASVSHQEAAAATLAALTAWQGLVHLARVKAGDKVMIHAASGGVGLYAVQIAKHFGAYVIGVSSQSGRELVLSYGADEHIDYNSHRFEELVQDADVVMDSVHDLAHLERSIDATRPKGRLISLVIFPDERVARKALMKRVFLYRMEVASDGDDMNAIADLMKQGKLRSHISKTFSFEELPQAHQAIETGHTKGKIVIAL